MGALMPGASICERSYTCAPGEHRVPTPVPVTPTNLHLKELVVELDEFGISERPPTTTAPATEPAAPAGVSDTKSEEKLDEEDEVDDSMTSEMRKLFLFGSNPDNISQFLKSVNSYCNAYRRFTQSPHFLHNRFFCAGKTLDFSEARFSATALQYFQEDLENNKRSSGIWLTPDQKQLIQLFLKNNYRNQDEHTVMTTNICDNKTLDNKTVDINTELPTTITCHEIFDTDLYCDAAAHGLEIDKEHIKLFVKDIQEDIGSDRVGFYCARSIPEDPDDAIAIASSCMIIRYPEERTLVLHFLATLPDYRNERIASTLVQYILNDARNHGYVRAMALAPSSAKNLYTRLGFLAGNRYTLYTK